MDHALEQEQENYRSRLYHFRGMPNTGRHVKSLSADNVNEPIDNDKSPTRIQGSKHVNEHSSDKQQVSWSLHRTNDKASKPRTPRDEAKDNQPSDLDLMKERFAKLLLGEDMSGGGKGVSSALALSNAFTNLAAAVFGEQKRLEPMGPERKARWRKEIDWLLSVTDHIVELVPTKQKTNGICMEIMTTKQRTDLQMNIPALRKLDAMLIDCLDNFKDQNEFYYVSKDEEAKEKGRTKRKDDKWWLPTPKVPPNGLSEMSKKWLQYQKDCVNQVLKAAMAINAQVLLEMEIPESYIESLPKNGRASLGESIYKGITDEFFDPEQFLSTMDMSSEHKILDLKNRIEASIVIWKRKMTNKDSKSSWPSSVSLEKREVFEERAETILLLLKQRFPGLPQSSLDISKIQCNRDVGHAILESYSRVLESLAFTVLSRIDDVLYADYCATHPSQRSAKRNPLKDSSFTMRTTKAPSPQEETERLSTCGTPTSGTLLDFMGWGLDQGDEKKEEAGDEFSKDSDPKYMNKVSNVTPTKKKVSYIDRLDNWGGSRSP